MFSSSSSQACFTRAQRIQARANSTSVCLERPTVAVAPSRRPVPPQQQQQQQRKLPDRQEAAAEQVRLPVDTTEDEVLRFLSRTRSRRSAISQVPASSSSGSHGRLAGMDDSDEDSMDPSASRPPESVTVIHVEQGTSQVMVVRGRRRRRTTSSGSNSSSSFTLKAVLSSRKRQWSNLHSKLLQSLRDEQLLPQHARVLLGVSGGQDSMAMLRLLHDLNQQQHWPLQLVVGHCDHRVRPDSADNAAHVQCCCEDLGVPYMQAVADRPVGHWSEAGAREWRHEQLMRMAAESGCGFLALGHTATERAETVLYNMIRGAGVRGLGSMSGSRQLCEGLVLIRPLLGFSRQETLQACELTHTQVYPDTTNTDQRYMRNLLRLSVFPLLQQINPSVVHHICSTAEMLHMEAELLEDWTEGALATALVPCHLVYTAKAGITTLSPLPLPQQQQQTQASVNERRQTQQQQQQEEEQLPLQQRQPCLRKQQQQLQQEQQHSSVQGMLSPLTTTVQGAGSKGASQRWQKGLSTAPMPLPGGQRHIVTQGYCLEQVFDCAEDLQRRQQQQHRQTEQQQQFGQQLEHAEPPQQQGSDEQGASSQGRSMFLDAVDIPAVLSLHPALQLRVLHLWLSQQNPKCAKVAQVREVWRLLQQGKCTGAKSSTLWGSSYVMRYQQVLLVVDAVTGKQVLSGDVQVQRVSVDVGALQEAAAVWQEHAP